MGSSPGWSQGFVPTVGQWNAAFAGKQDQLAYTPLNKGGDIMQGPLITTASIAAAAGFNIPPGTAPTNPNAGDIWNTGANFFAEIGSAPVAFNMYDGATIQIGPLTPTGTTTGGSGVMMGLGSGAAITPLYSSRAFISMEGFITNGTLGNEVIGLFNGTGVAPANGSAPNGYSHVGGTMTISVPVGGQFASFTMAGVVTGLTPGVAYWFDLSLSSASGLTRMTVTSITLYEM